MSKLHVTQTEGYLKSKLDGRIDMSDYAHHSDQSQVKKAFSHARACCTGCFAHD